MMFFGKCKRYFFIGLFLGCFFLPLSAKELSSGEKNALHYIRELAFEVTRYNATGISSMPESMSLAQLSKIGSNLLTQQKSISSPKDTVYFFEFYNPSFTGIIDSTFCPEDLTVVIDEEAEEPESSEESEEKETEIQVDESIEDELVESENKKIRMDWIDYLLQSLDSYSEVVNADSFDVRDGSKILEMLEGGDNRGIDGLEESKIEEELPQEFTYIKKDGNLRRFSYDGEQFTSWKEGDDTILVNFYGEKLIRKKFDSLYRLIKTEKFKFSGSAQNISLENSIKYDYSGAQTLPSKSTEDNFTEKKRVKNEYDSEGRIVMLLESHYEEREIKSKNKNKSSDSEKAEKSDKPATETVLLDDKKTSKVFDEKGRAVEQEIVTWTYKKTLSGRFNRNERSVKTVFDYSSVTEENKLPPNLKFYENGELHLERKYSGSGSYSEKLYFEDGFSVEVLYENGVKTTEIIYVNGKELRRREFEH